MTSISCGKQKNNPVFATESNLEKKSPPMDYPETIDNFYVQFLQSSILTQHYQLTMCQSKEN